MLGLIKKAEQFLESVDESVKNTVASEENKKEEEEKEDFVVVEEENLSELFEQRRKTEELVHEVLQEEKRRRVVEEERRRRVVEEVVPNAEVKELREKIGALGRERDAALSTLEEVREQKERETRTVVSLGAELLV